jgi:hypothetical protein
MFSFRHPDGTREQMLEIASPPVATEQGLPIDAIGKRNNLLITTQEDHEVGLLAAELEKQSDPKKRGFTVGDHLIDVRRMTGNCHPLAVSADHDARTRIGDPQAPNGRRVEKRIPDPRRAEDENKLGILGKR